MVLIKWKSEIYVLFSCLATGPIGSGISMVRETKWWWMSFKKKMKSAFMWSVEEGSRNFHKNVIFKGLENILNTEWKVFVVANKLIQSFLENMSDNVSWTLNHDMSIICQ